MAPEDLRDPNAIYNKMTFAQFQSLTPNIPWNSYFLGLSSPNPPPSILELNVGTLEFFTVGMNQILSLPIQQLKAYLLGHLLTSSANLLSEPFLEERFKWRQALYGVAQPPKRWEVCVSVVDSSLGELLGRYFIERKFNGNSKVYADQLVNELKTAFSQNLNDISWMDDTTKQAARGKLQQFITKIGYPGIFISTSLCYFLKMKFNFISFSFF